MRILFFIFRYFKTKRKFSMRFLRPDPAWNSCKLLKLMFIALVIPVASVFKSTCYLFSNQYAQRKMIYATQFVRCFLFSDYF